MNIFDSIKRHDVTFAYSDDHSVYRRGKAEYDAIVSYTKAHPEMAAEIITAWTVKMNEVFSFDEDVVRYRDAFVDATA